MKKISFLILLVVVLIGVTSCEPTYEKEYNWAYPVSGDWIVNEYVNNAIQSGPYEIKTYNSSYGQDSIWLDDYDGNYKDLQVKAFVDMQTKTFNTTGSLNILSSDTTIVKITNGRIIGKDSIIMDLEFNKEPGIVYTLAGHRETGYDEYVQK